MEIHAKGFAQVNASIGIATIAESNCSSQEALQLADTRMYIEKHQGKEDALAIADREQNDLICKAEQ